MAYIRQPRGLRRSGPPPISRHSAQCDGVCGARVGAGHGESIAAGTDSGAGVHGDGIDAGGEDRRPHRWGERGSCVKRWRTAVVVDRPGTEDQPMAGAGDRRTAMRHVPAALRARIGERAGGVRFPSRCSSGLPSHLRTAWSCARAVRPLRCARRQVGEGARSGGSTAGMPGEGLLSRKRAASVAEAALNCGTAVGSVVLCRAERSDDSRYRVIVH